MNVVMRCPSCGTTQGTAGECAACHEAQVRFFCTSHKVWLDGPTCSWCAEARPTPPRREVPVRLSPRVTDPPSIGSWVARIALRLLLVAVALGLVAVGAVYWLVHSLE